MTYVILSLLALSLLFPKFGLFMVLIIVFIYEPSYIWIIIILVVLGAIFALFSNKLHTPEKLVWRGKMKCNDCGYVWISRRDYPPAKCANCRSNYISIVEEL